MVLPVVLHCSTPRLGAHLGAHVEEDTHQKQQAPDALTACMTLCCGCCDGCAGKNFSEHQLGTLEYSAAVGQAWGIANQRALMWAGERATAVHGTHSVVRCAGSFAAHGVTAD